MAADFANNALAWELATDYADMRALAVRRLARRTLFFAAMACTRNVLSRVLPPGDPDWKIACKLFAAAEAALDGEPDGLPAQATKTAEWQRQTDVIDEGLHRPTTSRAIGLPLRLVWQVAGRGAAPNVMWTANLTALIGETLRPPGGRYTARELSIRLAVDALRDTAGNPFVPRFRRYHPQCGACHGRGADVMTRDGGGFDETECRRCYGKGYALNDEPKPWINATTLGLATAAYENRLGHGELDDTLLAVFADALEEDGCDDRTLLRQLREVNPCANCDGVGRLACLTGGDVDCIRCSGTGREPYRRRWPGFWPVDFVRGAIE